MPAFAGMTRRTCHPAAGPCRPCRNDETRYSGVRDGANIVILPHPADTNIVIPAYAGIQENGF
jgi:hypothetical protein